MISSLLSNFPRLSSSLTPAETIIICNTASHYQSGCLVIAMIFFVIMMQRIQLYAKSRISLSS